MKDIRRTLIIILTFQVFTTFGQTEFHLGKYKAGGSFVFFKPDSTFEFTGQLGCFGNTTTDGKFSIKKDTLILDTGIPIEWSEYPRMDDSLIITIRDVTTNKPIPNVRVAYKFIPKTSNYLSTDSRGRISMVRQKLDSVFIDRGVIQWYNDSAMLKLSYTFFNDYPDGKYKIESYNGVDLIIFVNLQLLDKYIILNKEKWLIIDAKNIFQPRPDWIENKGQTFTLTEK